MKSKGFTLAELLIALAILGVIATFTIPKVLQSQADQQKKAVFRETIAMLSDLVYSGKISGQIRDVGGGDYSSDWILDNVNAIKICRGNSATLGCWDNSAGTVDASSNSGFVLASGATVFSPAFNGPGDDTNWGVGIDYNGTKPPNAYGDDQITLYMCLTDQDCVVSGRTFKRMTVGPIKFGGPSNSDSLPLWEQIFSN